MLTNLLMGRRGNSSDRLLTGLFLLSAIIFILFGTIVSGISGRSGFFTDFAALYWPSRCAIHGFSPYLIENVSNEVLSSGGDRIYLDPAFWALRPLVYPPLSLYMISPLAVFSYPIACILTLPPQNVSLSKLI